MDATNFGGSEWAVSLHGGHSEFCDHGKGRLRDIVAAAVTKGYRIFGVTEHAPRFEPRHLYPEEIAMGWDIAKVQADFEAFARESAALVDEYEQKRKTGLDFTLLRGFEAEVIPQDSYAELMTGLRRRHGFDYIVGSVHWVNGIIIDHSRGKFVEAAAACGGQEALAVRYYQTVAEMVRALRPEVVGHLDVIRRYAAPREEVETPAVQDAALAALEVVREFNCIVDINTGGLYKGTGSPYPAPWLLRAVVHDFGIGVCFGDDSHSASDVGAALIESRQYLLDNGVREITYLTREDGAIVCSTATL